MSHFVQLNAEDCTYLLELIQDMDMDTGYTEKQRSYTIPKLQRILQDPRSARLAAQDVDYLLELMEDDDVEDCIQQREMTRASVLEIRQLQIEKATMLASVESQRESRRGRRQGGSFTESAAENLSERFQQTQ